MNFHIVTPTEAQANERHRAFLEAIRARASQLQAGIPPQHRPQRMTKLQPESFPAETDPPKKLPVTRVDIILRLTCEAFGFRLNEIKSARREQRLIMARQTAMYLCKRFTSQSFPWIGRQFGDRHHTTVLHACRRVERMMLDPPGTAISNQWSADECDVVREKCAYLIRAFCELEASLETNSDC